jgi:isoleucyl-tRNA synthetase
MAPILVVTADELWRHLPGPRDESVHLAVYPAAAELTALVDARVAADWTRLVALRERVLAEIEPLRQDKRIGSSLQARVVISAPRADLSFYERYARELPMLFIVSEVELRLAPPGDAATQKPEPRIAIERVGGVKCERCWRYVPSVSSDPDWAGLCARCQGALGAGGPREAA